MTEKKEPTDLHRTDEDRVDFIESHTYEIHSMSCGYFAIDLRSNLDVFSGDTFFGTWREIVDALLDQHQGN